MAKPVIEPISAATLPEFAAFLTENMTVPRSAEDWQRGLSQNWSADQPNYGFLLRDQGKVVGGIGAFYADRVIRGATERFCNITSWCVLDAYRQQSMRLAMAVIAQPGYHFTDFSPTAIVGGTLRFLKFKPLDERQAVIANLPCLPLGGRVVTNPAEIEQCLTGEALRAYREHTRFPGLKQVLVGAAGAWCHVIYKRDVLKGLPAARVIYLSDSALFDRYLRRLGGHWLLQGLPLALVECRSLKRIPWPSAIRSGFNAKVYLSKTLTDADIDYLYSESVALDLF